MKLELQWKDREGEVSPQGATKTARHFLDFVIDGEPLHPRIQGDFISCLGDWDDAAEAASLLLDAPPTVDGRTSIYVCPECGDINCGAITAVISRDGQDIVWKDIAHTGPDYSGEFVDFQHDLLGIDDLRFSESAYRATIENRPKE